MDAVNLDALEPSFRSLSLGPEPLEELVERSSAQATTILVQVKYVQRTNQISCSTYRYAHTHFDTLASALEQSSQHVSVQHTMQFQTFHN